MRVRFQNDMAVIDGYVNVVERDSKMIYEGGKSFIEKVKQGAFARSLSRRGNVRVLLNHDHSRELASVGDGTAVLKEDQVGLYCRTIVTDPEVIEKARAGKLSGWSFGFMPLTEKMTEIDDVDHRDLVELDLREVSILDDTKSPAYPACCISARDEEGETIEIRFVKDETQIEDANPGGDADNLEREEAGDPAGNYSFRNALYRAQIH